MMYTKHIILIFIYIFLNPSNTKAFDIKYSSTPPFMTQSLKPNVTIIMDYSGSMRFPAYYTCTSNSCGTIDKNYDKNIVYYGYFNTHFGYKYIDNQFEKSSCIVNNNIGTSTCISGNLLNFILMSRFDVAAKTLIGGKHKTDTKNILAPIGVGTSSVLRDNILKCSFSITSDTISNVVKFSATDYANGICPIKFSNNRYGFVKIDEADHIGIIQKSFDKVRFNLISFQGSGSSIKYSFGDNSLEKLVTVIESIWPNGKTPTKSGVQVAYDHFKQISIQNEYNNEKNDPFKYLVIQEDGTKEYKKVPCIKSYILLITDGKFSSKSDDPTQYLHKLHTEDLRIMGSEKFKSQSIKKIYSIFTFAEDEKGENSTKISALFGSYSTEETTENFPYPFTKYPHDAREITFPLTECDPQNSFNQNCKMWDKETNGIEGSEPDGIPDTYFKINNGIELERILTKIFNEIQGGSAAGSAVSMLSQQKSAGTLMNQAIFSSELKIDESSKLKWIGRIFSFWFYNSRTYQNIREDTTTNKRLKICGTNSDDIMKYNVNDDGSLSITTYAGDCNGNSSYESSDKKHLFNDIVQNTDYENIETVWEAGLILKNQNADNRNIFTVNTNNNKVDFTVDKSSQFADFLGNKSSLPPCLNSDKNNLINYIRGNYIPKCRDNRMPDGKVWKLGDIIYSTPQVVNYGKTSYLFVGANDGMLHVFNAGHISHKKLQTAESAIVSNNAENLGSSDELGSEIWAFIPKNMLPYLRALPNPDYKHMYFVDGKPYIHEIDTNNDKVIDKRILIGGFRLGGAVTSCTGSGCITPPSDTCPQTAYSQSYEENDCIGRASYFALDITSPESPEFLWEYTHKDLGMSYSGPAVITKIDSQKEQHTYVMFLSGPANYKGKTTANLKSFILEVDNDLNITDTNIKDFGISGYFGGRLFTSGVLDDEGNTKALFFGISNEHHGNVYGIKIKGESPSDWIYTKLFTTDIEPVTAQITSKKCFTKDYIYFGSGRWFYKNDKMNGKANYIYGYHYNPDNIKPISTQYDISTDKQGSCSVPANTGRVWKIKLSKANEINDGNKGYYKERMISNPTPSQYNNYTIFNTTAPSEDLCAYGGHSRLWAVNCATGGNVFDPCSYSYDVENPPTTILAQYSIGNIEQIKGNKTSFSENGNRATKRMPGTTSEEGAKDTERDWDAIRRLLLWMEK